MIIPGTDFCYIPEIGGFTIEEIGPRPAPAADICVRARAGPACQEVAAPHLFEHLGIIPVLKELLLDFSRSDRHEDAGPDTSLRFDAGMIPECDKKDRGA